MTWLRVIASRLRAVFTRQRLDHEFDDELRDHMESLIEEYQAAGMSHGDARRAAVLRLGHPQQLREANRDHRGMPLLESLAQDLGTRAMPFRSGSPAIWSRTNTSPRWERSRCSDDFSTRPRSVPAVRLRW